MSTADFQIMTALSDHINIAITRARLYTEARENEQKYRSVVENIDEIIFQLDKEGRLIFLNPSWTEVTGCSMTETLGTHINLYVYPDDRLRHQAFMAMNQMNNHESFRAEFRYVTKAGENLWVKIHTRLLEDAEGEASSLFGSINDITERKHMDEERLRLSKLEAIGPLAGGIAHDFNNLLTGIVGHIAFAQLLITPETSEEMAPRLQMAERATMEARKLTHQLLTFARGGAPVKQITSIRTVIYEAAIFISSGSNVLCDFDIPEDLWPCDMDSGQIGQVIQIRIINARQAMPDGGGVTISSRNLSSVPDPELSLNQGPYVSIDVKDDGEAILPEYQEEIFDPYFSTKEEGSGLGLATAYSILTSHDGVITLSSEVNVGTTFTIYLPATPEHAVSLDVDHPDYVFGEGRILVMEDEKNVRILLGEILTHCGYTSTLTANGEEAVQAYREAFEASEPYKAIIMDLTVKGNMGGKEAMQLILNMDPSARATVASGHSNDPVLAHYQDHGFLDRVQKPYRPTVLSKVLNDLIMAGNTI